MSGTMGKLGRAWVGAWVVHGGLHGWCLCGWCGGGGNCMCILPGLVVSDLGVGSSLVDDGEEVFGVVSLAPS